MSRNVAIPATSGKLPLPQRPRRDLRLSPRQQLEAWLRAYYQLELWLVLAAGKIDEDFRRARLQQLRSLIKRTRLMVRLLDQIAAAADDDHLPAAAEDARARIRYSKTNESRGPPRADERPRPGVEPGSPLRIPKLSGNERNPTAPLPPAQPRTGRAP